MTDEGFRKALERRLPGVHIVFTELDALTKADIVLLRDDIAAFHADINARFDALEMTLAEIRKAIRGTLP